MIVKLLQYRATGICIFVGLLSRQKKLKYEILLDSEIGPFCWECKMTIFIAHTNWYYIHNTPFSSWLTNRSNKLDCYITLSLNGLAVKNTNLLGRKKMKNCEYARHRYRKSQNRLLEVCCVPATSAGLPMVSFFFFLLQWPFTVLIKQTRQAVRAIKQYTYS
jgi:hypothetical protein